MIDSISSVRSGAALAAAVAVLAGFTFVAVPLSAQGESDDALDEVVESARRAWLEHDVSGLVSRSDTVRLRIPGVAPSAALRPGQAKSLLEQYLKTSEELSFDLRDLRMVAADHAYAEMGRSYVVEGTTERREETVFLGFRFVAEGWRLREVRVAP